MYMRLRPVLGSMGILALLLLPLPLPLPLPLLERESPDKRPRSSVEPFVDLFRTCFDI